MEPETGCHVWLGATSHGYGRIGLGGRGEGTGATHRFIYEAEVGPIPEGMDLDHRCHNRRCCNPEHLRVCTRKENLENHQGSARADNASSGVRGVHWHAAAGRWRVRVGHRGHYYSGGLFADLAEAEAAAIQLRIKLFTHNDVDKKGVA